MKIVIAPDKFKGSLTASEVCDIVQSELLSRSREFDIITLPLADGGEGTCELLTELSNGRIIEVDVLDPLHRKIKSSYGISGDGHTAFIEMAKASGLQLLKPIERNCTVTSTYGTGQLIRSALEKNVTEIVMGIGGSATNDAGLGMAKALGFQLYSRTGEELKGIGADLTSLNDVDFSQAHEQIRHTKFITLCDVKNPLYGPNGASFVFAKQKGASDKEIKMLDTGLQNFAAIASQLNCDVNFPGAGAAGGLGAGSKLFLNTHIQSGTDFLINFTRLEEKIKEADVVITGEGKLDIQTLSGKVVDGVATLARRHNKKLIIIAGSCELNKKQIDQMGITQLITLKDHNTSEVEAIEMAKDHLKIKAALIQM